MSGQPTGSATTASLSHVGRVRTINQDDCAEFVKPDGMQLLVVADGMGGHLGGEVASRTAVEAIAGHAAVAFSNARCFEETAIRAQTDALTGLALRS